MDLQSVPGVWSLCTLDAVAWAHHEEEVMLWDAFLQIKIRAEYFSWYRIMVTEKLWCAVNSLWNHQSLCCIIAYISDSGLPGKPCFHRQSPSILWTVCRLVCRDINYPEEPVMVLIMEGIFSRLHLKRVHKTLLTDLSLLQHFDHWTSFIYCHNLSALQTELIPHRQRSLHSSLLHV